MIDLIKYNKTVVGWYNFTVAGLLVYNIEPETFEEITGISSDAQLGTCEVTTNELIELKQKARFIGLEGDWQWVSNDAI